MKTRKEIRLKNYDYSKEGIYYVTICSYQRKNTFCKIDDRIFDIEFNDTDFDKYIENIDYVDSIMNTGIKDAKLIEESYKILVNSSGHFGNEINDAFVQGFSSAISRASHYHSGGGGFSSRGGGRGSFGGGRGGGGFR